MLFNVRHLTKTRFISFYSVIILLQDFAKIQIWAQLFKARFS